MSPDGVGGGEYLEDLPGDVAVGGLLLAAKPRGVDHQDRPGRVSPPVSGPAQLSLGKKPSCVLRK